MFLLMSSASYYSWDLFLNGSKVAGGTAYCFGSVLERLKGCEWSSYDDVKDRILRTGSALYLKLPELVATADKLIEKRAKFSVTPGYFEMDLTKEKMEDVGAEDCCSPSTAMVSGDTAIVSKQTMGGFRDPNAEVAETFTHYGNQFDYPGARRWRTVGLLSLSKQRKECMTTLLAGAAYGVTTILLGPTLRNEDIFKIIHKTKCRAIIGDESRLTSFFEFIKSNQEPLLRLLTLISFGNVGANVKVEAAQHGIRFLTWANLYELSRGKVLTAPSAAGNALAVVIFDAPLTIEDSTRTGSTPDGVMLTHRNLLLSAAAFSTLTNGTVVTRATVYYSQLPFSDPLELTILSTVLSCGGRIAFCGVPFSPLYFPGTNDEKCDLWLRDIVYASPTLLLMDPKFAVEIYREIQIRGTIAKRGFLRGLKESRFKSHLRRQIDKVQNGDPKSLGSGIWHGMFFRKYKNLLGNSLNRLLFTYGIDEEIYKTLQIIFQVPIYTIYGNPYTSGIALTGNRYPAKRAYHYNQLLPSIELPLIKPGARVHLRVRGASVSPGTWFLDHEKSREADFSVDHNGWHEPGVTIELPDDLAFATIVESNGQVASTSPHLRIPFINAIQLVGTAAALVTISQRAVDAWRKQNSRVPLETVIETELNAMLDAPVSVTILPPQPAVL